MKTFFSHEDYLAYLELIAQLKDEAGVCIWAYCLMPNHVHLVVVPECEDSLAIFFRQVHRHYTRRINFREGWRGHLWQERFHSFVMNEQHLVAAVRYTELNPVRARLCDSAERWAWSSARAHLAGIDDTIVSVRPMLERINDWSKYLGSAIGEAELQELRKHTSTGRPAGDRSFLEQLEALTGRDLKKKKPGPKPADG